VDSARNLDVIVDSTFSGGARIFRLPGHSWGTRILTGAPFSPAAHHELFWPISSTGAQLGSSLFQPGPVPRLAPASRRHCLRYLARHTALPFLNLVSIIIIRDLRRLRNSMDQATACAIAIALVHFKLDYCSSLLLNLPSSSTNRLQFVLNSAARAVTKTPKFHHITPVLKSVHWLKVNQRINYKIMSLAYKSLLSNQPSYLFSLLSLRSFYSTHSSSIVTLARPSNPSRIKLMNRSFYHTATALWNNLPIELRAYARNINLFHHSFPPIVSSSSYDGYTGTDLAFYFHLTGHFHLSFMSFSLFILFVSNNEQVVIILVSHVYRYIISTPFHHHIISSHFVFSFSSRVS
jgi:hypothetical protein